MIIDTLDNLYKYIPLHPLFADVMEFIKSNNLSKLADSRYEIKPNDLSLIIATTTSKTKDTAILESHRKMIDIQIPLNTSETYGYSHVKTLPKADYDADKDITFYPDIQPKNYVTCEQGMFIIFFPQDGHAPCISQSAEIHKAIFKIKA